MSPLRILTIGNSFIRYEKTAEYGLGVEELSGGNGVGDYIRAAQALFAEVKELNRYYAGGEAEIALAGMSAVGGEVSLTFVYTYDNLRITGGAPAFVAVFEDGVLREASLYTMAVRTTGERMTTWTEWWFRTWLIARGVAAERISLVYPADFVSERVNAEWAAEMGETEPYLYGA